MLNPPNFDLNAFGKTVMNFLTGLLRKAGFPVFLMGKAKLKARLHRFTDQLRIARKMGFCLRQLLRNRTAGVPGGFFLIQVKAADDEIGIKFAFHRTLLRAETPDRS